MPLDTHGNPIEPCDTVQILAWPEASNNDWHAKLVGSEQIIEGVNEMNGVVWFTSADHGFHSWDAQYTRKIGGGK